jgi:hypothetical protein
MFELNSDANLQRASRLSQISSKERPMRKWLVSVIVLVGVVAVGVAGQTSQPQTGDAKDAPSEGFAGKIILVSTGNSGHTLKNVQTRKLGDRSFLVGTAVRDTNLTQEPFGNRPTWIPVSEIKEMVEFDDLAQLRRFGNSQP